MSFNIKNVIEGWRNELIPPRKLKEAIEQVSEQRLSFCISCEHNSTPGEIKRFSSKCLNCGCFLSAKSKAVDEQCPLNPPKWEAVGSLKDDEDIKEALRNEHSS